MLQLPREGRVIDEVKVRLGTIHYISLGGGGPMWKLVIDMHTRYWVNSVLLELRSV